MYKLKMLLTLATVALAFDHLAKAQDRPAPVDETRMNGLWVDLEKVDLEKEVLDASRALLQLSATPGETVAFLRKKMKPLKIEAEKVKALLDWLGSNDETIWKPAFEELEYFDPRLEIDLVTLMSTVTETPARQRMVEVLCGRKAGAYEGKEIRLRNTGVDSFNFSSDRGSWWAEVRIDRLNNGSGDCTKKKWIRAIRAIALLEYLGTPDAMVILKDMATGHPDAQPTKAAKEALERIAEKAKGKGSPVK